ncbi:MAG: methyltransferase regulatory domain-containing protein, partial [Pyrinomonadaceae bacterium]
MQDHIYPPQVAETLRGLAQKHIVLKEQYLDFLKCRRFRQTLLCHDDVAIDRSPKPEILTNLYFASIARPVSEHPEINSKSVEEFRGAKGGRMATDFPLAKAAMLHLGEIYPQALHFRELLDHARARLGQDTDKQTGESEQEAQTLAEILLGVHAAGVVEIHVYVPRCAHAVSERPVASPLARFQVESDNNVTTLRHTIVSIEDLIGQKLLALLDGTRDRAALIEELQTFVKSDVVAQSKANAATVDIEKVLQDVANDLEDNLAKLARLGLLIA